MANNSAARLLEIIQKVQGYRGNSTPAWEIWAKILGSPNDFTLLVVQLAKIYQLPGQIKSDVEAFVHPAKQAVCLEWFPNVSTAIKSSSWNARIHDFAGLIADTDVLSLRVCAAELSVLVNEKDIKQKEIDDLLQQINSLEAELKKSSLPPDVLKYIQLHLNEIRTALRDFKITGTGPLEASIERAAGSLIVSPEIAVRSAETKEGMQFWGIVAKVNTLVQVTWNSLQIMDTIAKCLPPN
jgi:hypothetical protein